jgi:hypothetical protein
MIFAKEISGAGMTMNHLSGICLMGLCVACRPTMLHPFYIGIMEERLLCFLGGDD